MYNIESIKSELPYYQEILLHYKVNPCLISSNAGEYTHNEFLCFNYHNLNERRRPAFDEVTCNLFYQPVKCPSIVENLSCLEADLCKYAHNQNEIDFHPLVYKTEPCQGCFYENNQKFCAYYHSDETSRKVLLEKTKTKQNKEVSKTSQNIPFMSQDPFSLDNFKSKPCPLKGNHNPKVCEYYHHDQDRKRPVSIYQYSANMCPYGRKDEPCANGDNCRFCHNKVEQLYHPERYKKKFCLSHPHNTHKCEYGNFCSFAHSENEIQVELLHNLKKDEDFYLYKYKTVFCPYIYEHDRNQCVYAHNPQDLRRDPKIYAYNPVQCTFWSQKQIFSYEEGGCPKHMQCENCHGWKELEFHPLYYRTKPCNNGKKCTKKDCPFYHLNSERRDTKPSSQLTQTLLGSQGVPNFTTPQKEPETDPHPIFDSSKSKFSKKKESHYSRPVMPVYIPVPKHYGNYEPKMKKGDESSTRTNSNISFIPFNEVDHSHEGPKRRKSKNMSLQTKTEKSNSPLSSKSDKPKGQATKDVFKVPINIWEPSENDSKKGLEELLNNFTFNKPMDVDGNKANDSFDSLHSFTVEKNVTSDKPTEVVNDQFLKTLFADLEKKGLEYTIPYLKSSGTDLESLKSFGHKDFDLFPQISTKDKEKIVRIIQDVLDGEALLLQINTIHEAPLITSSPQTNIEESGIYGNFGASDTNNDFKNVSFFQRHSY